jgi:anti-sigma B factor antagonist
MNCVLTEHDDGIRLAISGALDALTVPEVRAVLDAVAAARPHRVVIDLSELTILDSSGVGAIVSLYKRIKVHDGTVSIVRVHGQPLLVLQALELDRVFAISAAG